MVIEYIRINPPLALSDFENLLQQLPEKQKLKNQKYRRYEDRLRNLFGLLLAKRQVSLHLNTEFDLTQLELTDYNRPYVPESEFDFNISHAGNYVVCSLAGQAELGIDIEQKKKVDFGDFQRTMNQEQWQYIYHSNNPIETFFQFWCIKESVIKADGRGLSIPLTEIIFDHQKISYPGHSWHYRSFQLDQNHLGCLACSKNFKKIELKEVDWRQLTFI